MNKQYNINTNNNNSTTAMARMQQCHPSVLHHGLKAGNRVGQQYQHQQGIKQYLYTKQNQVTSVMAIAQYVTTASAQQRATSPVTVVSTHNNNNGTINKVARFGYTTTPPGSEIMHWTEQNAGKRSQVITRSYPSGIKQQVSTSTMVIIVGQKVNNGQQ